MSEQKDPDSEVREPTVGRRRFAGGLAVGGLAVGGGVLSAGLSVPASAASSGAGGSGGAGPVPSRSGHYVPNRAPLRPVPFQKLPPGAVRPRGWLAGQLDRQRRGLGGRYDEVSDFLRYENNGWVDPTQGAWEELPYWLRGLGDLGYVTGDPDVLAKAERWIEGVLGTQADDGWFGPEELRTSLEGGPELWAAMPMLTALRSWQEYSGDERVVPFMTEYFRFVDRQAPEVFGRSWGAYRWGDNLDTVYWLYNRTGDGWLLDLARRMHENSADYVGDIPTWHNVNLAQGFREPLQYGLLDGEERFREATYGLYRTIMARYGQFSGGGFAGDENCRPGFGDPRQGFETCGIVEYMRSFEMLTRFTGDTGWADRCEELAFNMLPAALDAEQRAIHYITSANSIQLDNGLKHGQFQNGFPMQAYKPGVHDYRCCPHNYGIGWPYFAEELWLATCDHGLAAAMYAPSEVRAVVGDGTEVTITEDTEYPFDELVTLTVSTAEPAAFPLYLRIPGWAEGTTVHLNGETLPVRAGPGDWANVERMWQDGDRLSVRFPMRLSARRWRDNHDSVSIDRGPLTYSLRIDERVEQYDGTETWPELALYPESPWNYGLVSPIDETLEVRRPGLGDDPFTHNPFTGENAPILLRARAKRIPEWEADAEDVVGLLQPSPARSEEPVETVTLIPMGAARLRITSFPTTPRGPGGKRWHRWPRASASHIFDGDSYEALYDEREPSSSADTSIPRFTWWDRRGSTEWVELDIREPGSIGRAAVYWFDDTGDGECRVPASWRVLWLDGDTWRQVSGADSYGTALDQLNVVEFDPVRARVFRVEADLQQGFSAGILELRIEA